MSGLPDRFILIVFDFIKSNHTDAINSSEQSTSHTSVSSVADVIVASV